MTKDSSGKVHVNKDEMATRHGGWGGAAAGAVIGILVSPSIIGTAIVGALPSEVWAATCGAAFPVLMSRSSANSSTMARPPSWSSARAPSSRRIDKAALKAEKHIAKQLDVSTADVDAAVKDAAGQVGWSAAGDNEVLAAAARGTQAA